MKTSRPFSTISYNSSDFLEIRLGELIARRQLDFFAWVHHYPEEDETKPHKHVYLVPNGKIDTDQVLDCLLELDPENPLKPLGCIRPRSSKFAHWYLYGLHDPAYLASIGQSRKYHYSLEDFHCSDMDYLLEEIHTIDFAKLNRFNVLRDAALNGTPFDELLLTGCIPIQQTYAYKQAYDILANSCTFRNGSHGHEFTDPDTGEIRLIT